MKKKVISYIILGLVLIGIPYFIWTEYLCLKEKKWCDAAVKRNALKNKIKWILLQDRNEEEDSELFRTWGAREGY